MDCSQRIVSHGTWQLYHGGPVGNFRCGDMFTPVSSYGVSDRGLAVSVHEGAATLRFIKPDVVEAIRTMTEEADVQNGRSGQATSAVSRDD